MPERRSTSWRVCDALASIPLRPMLVAVAGMMLASGLLDAQSITRVRITAVAHYRVGEAISIERQKVSGSGITSTTGEVVEVRLADSTIAAIPKPGRRVVGRAVAIDDTIVTLVLDGRSESIRVPLDAIGTLEVSRGRGSRGRALGGGIATGVAGFFGGAWLAMAICGNVFDCDGAAFLGGVGGALGLGGFVGGRMGRERWETIPVDQLSHEFVP